MILAIDVGNTNIVLGGWEGDKLTFFSRLETNKRKTGDGYAIEFKSLFELYRVNTESIDGSIISSVVPQITGSVQSATEKITGKKPLIVGPGIKTGLNIRIDNPSELGSDIVADAVAAISQYPKPIIVFDMGTATVISVINKDGLFLGGVIVTGTRTALDALSENAAQLPQVDASAPARVIGSNTIDSMMSGAVYGTVCMIDGMIDRIEREIGQKATVVATGGNSMDIVPLCDRQIIRNPNLLLEGLMILYQKNTAEQKKV